MPHAKINGCSLFYTDQGDGEVVLLIHGLGSSTRDWEYQLPSLLPQYRVICLDMRGHGQSDKPKGGYSIKGFADDCIAFIEKLNLEKPHIVGISMGGMIAFQLATQRPELPASLTIVNSAPEVIPRKPAEYVMVAKRLFFAHVLPLSVTARGLAKLLFPKPEHATIRETFESRWNENDRSAYLASLRAIIGWGVSDRLDRINCPVLVISGDQDYTPVESKREYVSRLGDARLEVIEDSRHGTPIDQADNFNALLLDFLRQSGSAAPTQNAMNQPL
ncbi:alpha/beta fold hydrolase [Halopseudomonas pelagia]|uniref:3-oxoadipate enol-lactonase n=1 Tax=Halopseudomonas pelagia TaxID=553151 RepID=A0AA91U4W3_9GAMM|nr:alpha/beta hydrolase [Halopseudomonas pelagia]PCD00716.1 3-oxoadipate enol-lactonase [Halopseudomonas pelagia]QFY56993.1 alpha/beta hydrolase [Halopseudomonas pelagia]